MTKKYVYSFKEGKKEMKEELGGKGANLAEMTSIGIPVPPGFTISTDACAEYYENDKKYPDNLQKQVDDKLEELEKEMDAKLGDNENPLLVSVRSGAAVSMPGMMDTVLNLGLNDSSVQGLIKKTGNERFAWDSYRRFINMFGNVVMDVPHKHFEEVIEKAKATKGVEVDTELDAEDLKNVCEGYKEVVQKHAGEMFPEDPREQLKMSIDAVFNSWNCKRAIIYRKINNITGLNGTAVNVQTMVFGNMGETSGTGVCFTRDPSTGENKFYGEFLMNAQGEDVVAGIRTPQPIIELKEIMDENYEELVKIREKLEKHYKDMQDIEFTIQDKKLYILQTRSGKRTAQAAIKMAIDMVEEKLIDKETALLRIDPEQLNHLLHKQLDPIGKEKAEVIAKGLPASPGAAVGVAAFTAEDAARFAEEGEKVILVRNETSPEDIEGMDASQGILTAKGGMTSHAAVVARGMGKCCVAGCADIIVNEKTKEFSVDGTIVKEKDWITLDGSAGEVMLGQVPVTDPELSGDFGVLMEWADEVRKLGIRTNADTPKDSKVALKFGAEGIGLCRTEHMFFEGERIKAVREMILSDDLEGRKKALAKLLPFQKADFKGLFEVMEGKPVKIRTLDPPLHEFLPKEEADIKEIAEELGVSLEKLKEKIEGLHEFNPMLGHRGCRLGITYPEITEMQARAIIEAACEVVLEKKIKVYPEIMIPLVGNVKELENQKKLVVKVAKEVMKEKGVEIDYEVGTMIEIPRAALTADEIALEADFFSFGTNDLTQMACGFSRDDSGTFLGEYVDMGIYPRDPFQAIDQTGVGELMKICVEKARKVKPKMHIGICGEHGGEPSSVEFCHRIGLDYVSCSPFRVPIARLAAAQAALRK
ncbi:MAG: pyruvate, phosphate dikinase [Candidatus Woesearchaeota archaeon]|nr:pyruvate, phosphate dikinase [Candidatus Woesearchaeota archaeon]